MKFKFNQSSAHSMDTVFIGLDENEELSLFYTEEDGVVPINASAYDQLVDFLEEKLSNPQSLRPQFDPDTPEIKRLIKISKEILENRCLRILFHKYTASLSEPDFSAKGYLNGEFDCAFNTLYYQKVTSSQEAITDALRSTRQFTKKDLVEVSKFIYSLAKSDRTLNFYKAKGPYVKIPEIPTPYRFTPIRNLDALDMFFYTIVGKITEQFWKKLKKAIKYTLEEFQNNPSPENPLITKEYCSFIIYTKAIMKNKQDKLTTLAIAYPELIKTFKQGKTVIISNQKDIETTECIENIKSQLEPYIIEIPHDLNHIDITLRNALKLILE